MKYVNVYIHREGDTLPSGMYDAVKLTLSSDVVLVDERFQVRLSGLAPSQQITIHANTKEKQLSFSGVGCFIADSNGEIDCSKLASVSGTYTGRVTNVFYLIFNLIRQLHLPTVHFPKGNIFSKCLLIRHFILVCLSIMYNWRLSSSFCVNTKVFNKLCLNLIRYSWHGNDMEHATVTGTETRITSVQMGRHCPTGYNIYCTRRTFQFGWNL